MSERTLTVGEIVRKMEDEWVNGTTQISKYVNFSIYDTLEKIEAYLNSKFTKGGEFDSQGRPKPFFNIVTAAVNIWFRATDIDRRHIKVRATKAKDWINSFLATVHLQDWMRREGYASHLNNWGRTLSRYGSAIEKYTENDEGLHISVTPWGMIICDAVNFYANPKIEILELTEAELRQRVDTHGYNKEAVKSLCEAIKPRETTGGQRKDNKTGYIKLYELHGLLPKVLLTGKEEDEYTYVQQMHIHSYVTMKSGRKSEYLDFTVFSGEEKEDPFEIAHLIEEDGRSLSIGAVEHLFQSQWQINHSIKSVKDTLDIANKLILQTSDTNLVGRNVLTNIMDGDILIYSAGNPLTKVENSKPDVQSWNTYAVQWKNLGNEINGISEAMLGAQPKSGTAWRQTEALLTENYSLFELMTENKGNYIERMMRKRIIPYIKRRKLNNANEIAATLEQYDIDKIDSIYIKNKATQKTNQQIKDMVLSDKPLNTATPLAIQQQEMQQENETSMRENLAPLGNQRFFKPDEITEKTWAVQFKDLEWDLEVDITGEARDTQEMLATLNTALKLVVTPGFEQNKKAQMIVGRILELTGAMSPIEYNSIPATPVESPIQPGDLPQEELAAPKNKERNIR